jgi:hypothetical protein
MHRRDKIRDDVMNGGKKNEKWVRNSTSPMPTFDPQQEK